MTKKVKLAIVLLATVASINLSAQENTTQEKTTIPTESENTKPTKEETMDWIAGKMKENLAGKPGNLRIFVSYSNGLFIYKIEDLKDEWYVTTIDLNKVTGMSNVHSTDFFISGKTVSITVLEGAKSSGTPRDFVSVSGPNYNNYSAPFNFTPDQALVERLKKAFTTLIEYNSSQKGIDEKF